MTAPAAPPPDLLLDACSALRADLAAREEGAVTPPPAGDAPPAPVDSAQVAAWLPLVVAVERAAQLPARARAAHFREARSAWDAAADACAEPRYGALGARLARWRAPDPRLPVVKEILWAFEQPEAAGYTHLALAGYTALGRLLPADDVRRGYVLAPSARALRTLGAVDAATERYMLSERFGTTHRDQWLRVRSAIGLGTTFMYVGNYPAAREVFGRVLKRGAPDARFTAAAHQGMLISAVAADDHETALTHGWHLLRAGRDGMIPRVDVWILMAIVCYKVGRFRTATHVATTALRSASRPEDVIVALHILVDVAAATKDKELGKRYAARLRSCVGGRAGPYEDVRALLALAAFDEAVSDSEAARVDLAGARRIAQSHGYHELAFRADGLKELWDRARTDPSPEVGRTPEVRLTPHSARIMRQLAQWSGYQAAGESNPGFVDASASHAEVV